MKNLIINIFLIVVFAFSLQNITIGKNLFLPFGDDDIVSETNQYLKRVNLDEGKVLSKNDLNKFIQTVEKEHMSIK